MHSGGRSVALGVFVLSEGTPVASGSPSAVSCPTIEASLHLEPENAFGEYQAELVCFEDRSVFPEHLEVGMQFDGLPEDAATPDMPSEVVYTVTEVYDSHVVLDGNHPLAGMALRLHLTVCDVREATLDEIEATSVGQPAFSVLNALQPGEHLH